MSEVQVFLDKLYTQKEDKNPHPSIRFIFNQLSDWLSAEKSELVEEAFVAVDVNKINIDQMLSFLTITGTMMVPPDALKNRSPYIRRVWTKIADLEGEDKARKLLQYYLQY